MNKGGPCWAELGIGRTGPVLTAFVLAKPKPNLTTVPEECKYLQSLLITPHAPLFEQYDALPAKPDLILLKCHKFIMSKTGKPFLKNIFDFIRCAGPAYKNTRLIPFHVQCELADRFSMVSLLEDVCAAAKRSQMGKYAVPAALNVKASASAIQAPRYVRGLLPAVIKPRDSSRHDLMFVVFDEVGLAHAATTLQEYRIEKFVNHGGWVYKVYVIGDELQVGRRPSLVDMMVRNRADLDRTAAALECDAIHVAASQHGGYLKFNSAKLTKGRVTGIPACQSLADSDLDPGRVRLLATALGQRLGCSLFGFDVLHNAATGTYYVVDVNIFPGYKGFHNFHAIFDRYLREQATFKAMTCDRHKLLQSDIIKRACIAAVPAWRDDKSLNPDTDLEITHIKSHNNNIFRVGRISDCTCCPPRKSVADRAQATCSKGSVIYRIGGERFQEQAYLEMELVEWLQRCQLGARIVTPIESEYFGSVRLLGRIEQCLPGRALGEYHLGHGGLQPRFYSAATALIGERLANFHRLAADPAFQEAYLKRHYRNWQDSILWRRLDLWKRQAETHVGRTAACLVDHPVWASLFTNLRRIVKELPEVVSRTRARLRCEYSLTIVFAHFDLTPNNVLISKRGSNTVELTQFPKAGTKVSDSTLTPEDICVALLDFEWSGPCAAVYDFAKFFLSSQMSILTSIDQGPGRLKRLQSSATQRVVSGGFRSMVHGYTRTMARLGVDIGAEEDFLADAMEFIPIAAAVNIFSNIMHAASDLLLEPSNVPSTTNLRLGPHQFNWLQHAANHCLLYDLSLSQLEGAAMRNASNHTLTKGGADIMRRNAAL